MSCFNQECVLLQLASSVDAELHYLSATLVVVGGAELEQFTGTYGRWTVDLIGCSFRATISKCSAVSKFPNSTFRQEQKEIEDQ